jgi:hypothetical protein
MPINVIASLDDVHALAANILDKTRAGPIVCVTTRHNESETLIDTSALAAACEPLVVNVLRTGELTFELTDSLPPRFEVYGGAARVWWPGLDPTDDPLVHPLVFCWERHDAAAAAERLLRLLRERGLATTATTSGATAFEVGDVVDATVTEVHRGGIEVEIPGGHRVMILNRRGRAGPAVQAGDVRRVEVVSTQAAKDGVEVGLRWSHDFDEIVIPAPARPSDLMRAVVPIPASETLSGAASETVSGGAPVAASTADTARLDAAWQRIAAAKSAVEEIRAAAREIPRDLDDGLAAAQARVVAFAEMEADDIVDDLKHKLAEALAEAETLKRRLASAEREQRAAIEDRHRQRDRASKLEKELKSEKGRRTYLENRLHGRGWSDDPEEQFRHEVTVACEALRDTENTPPPVAYVLGPDFLKSIARTEGVDRELVVTTIAEVLTGIRLGRGHPFRVSEAANAAQRVRDADGAKAYRHYLQHKTPGARRLHYWQLRDGTIELANIAVHDDMGIR